jgi:hypothetical protein
VVVVAVKASLVLLLEVRVAVEEEVQAMLVAQGLLGKEMRGEEASQVADLLIHHEAVVGLEL